MPRPYPRELRERVLRAYDCGSSRSYVAEQFNISRTTLAPPDVNVAFEVKRVAQRRRGAEDNAVTDNDITGAIVDAAYRVHTRLGPGLL